MREQRIHLRVSQDEYDLIQQKRKQSGCINMSAYLRKMAIDGLIVKLDMSEMKEILHLLQYNGNNINQIAKRMNESKTVYSGDDVLRTETLSLRASTVNLITIGGMIYKPARY